MSSDGSRVWFATTEPLVNADTDETNDLYMAKIENGQLSELVLASAGDPTVAHPIPGHGADVGEDGVQSNPTPTPNQGVVRVSPSGEQVAFESGNVLTEEENALHQTAVKGANNMYVYDVPTGETKFVAELCSGYELSGSEWPGAKGGYGYQVTSLNAVQDSACPANGSNGFEPYINFAGPRANNDGELWLYEAGGEARFSDNGRYLLFTSWGRLTPDDTDNVRDLFRYDFVTGRLIRLSFGRNGNDANGNDDLYPVEFEFGQTGTKGNELGEDEQRSVSEDGSVSIFSTAAPLVSHDTNSGTKPQCTGSEGTGCDIYEWEEEGHGTCTEGEDGSGGCVRLITDGVNPHGSRNGVMSASGNEISFLSTRNVIPADTDGVADDYVARVDGGFHTPHPPSPCGGNDACLPQPSAAPAAPTLGTPNFIGPGNAKEKIQCARGRHRAKRQGQVRCVPNHKKHKHHRRKSGRLKRAHRRAAGSNRGGAK